MDIKNINSKRTAEKVFLTIVGNVIYAAGNNLCILPLHLYSGGFTGVAQLIRMFLYDFLNLPMIPGIDIVGVIYFLINAPFFIYAYKVMGKKFCITTLISIAMASACLSLIPIPKVPIIDDRMLASVVGGLGSGVGAGMVLRAGSSQGGQDLLGACLAKTHPNFKVGTIGIIISCCVYSVCLFMYDITTVLFSIIFAVVTGVCVNKVHIQNIKMQAMIFTKKEGLVNAIMTELRRGVTTWEGVGAYTNEDSHIIVTVLSKYELPILEDIIARIDPQAFVIVQENAQVLGNFEKRFTE